MSFSDEQIRQLKSTLKARHVKQRCANGKVLHYVEGWHALAEANRIFGYENWDRETVSNQCVWQKTIDGQFCVAYLAKVRVTVRAGSETIIREGQGSGEAVCLTPGQSHERAAKVAETDATKRALATFGNPFGLSLYSGKIPRVRRKAATDKRSTEIGERPTGMVVDDVSLRTPIARSCDDGGRAPGVDKSNLVFGEPKRRRNEAHLQYVRGQSCLICGRVPSQAHHLRFAQPQALGRKVSDEFTVPLCAIHHDELHRFGKETEWWARKHVDALAAAEKLWRSTSNVGKSAGMDSVEQLEQRRSSDSPAAATQLDDFEASTSR